MDKLLQGVFIAVIVLGSGYLVYSFVVPTLDFQEESEDIISTGDTGDGSPKEQSTGQQVIFCKQDNTSYEYNIGDKTTSKLDSSCPSFINSGGGAFSYFYSPNGLHYVRVIDNNGLKVVFGALTERNQLKATEETEIYSSTAANLRFLGWGDNETFFVREASDNIDTGNSAYGIYDEAFIMIKLDGSSTLVFEGTGGHFSSFEYLGYDPNRNLVLGCRPSVEGCREFINVNPTTGNSYTDTAFLATSISIDFVNQDIYYSDFANRNMRVYSYSKRTTSDPIDLPGYRGGMLVFSEVGDKIYFVSKTFFIASNVDTILSYDISDGSIASAISLDESFPSISLFGKSANGQLILVWSIYTGTRNLPDRYFLLDVTNNTLSQINTDSVWGDSFRFSYFE